MSTSTSNTHDSDLFVQVASAVEYLAATHIPDLTVWRAFEQALHWWTAAHLDVEHGIPERSPQAHLWDDPDPLRSTIERVLEIASPAELPDGHRLAEVFASALDFWVETMAAEFNDGHTFTETRLLSHSA